MISLNSAWDVLVLFLIPIGGGIPAGVIVAQHHGFSWIIMTVLYLISDIILAICFEPIMLVIKRVGKNSAFFARWVEAFKKSTDKIISKYGVRPSAFTLIMISFGVDPMTGRTAALAAGHNFLTGWTLAIMGDMIFFTILMVSTLWLNNILGDGTWTAIIITVAFMVIHFAVQNYRQKREATTVRKE